MDFIIEGIGSAPSNRVEYTSGSVLRKYLEEVAVLKDIYDRRAAVDAGFTPLTTTDFDNLGDALKALRTLAQEGEMDPVTQQRFYLTTDMAINLDLVFRSLKSAGITLQAIDSNSYSNSMKVFLLENWQSLAGFGVQDIMNAAASVSSNATRTLQSMIELEYVKQGNDLLAIQFEKLEQVLRVTDNILQTLKTIQGISNQITVENRGDFAFPPTNEYQVPAGAIDELSKFLPSVTVTVGGVPTIMTMRQLYDFNVEIANQAVEDAIPPGSTTSTTTFSAEMSKLVAGSLTVPTVASSINTFTTSIANFVRVYKIVASAQFRQVFPIATPTDTAATELIAAKQKLMIELVDLEAITPTDGSPSQNRLQENTLASFMFKVAIDISNAFKNIDLGSGTLQDDYKAAVSTWILDNQDQKAGSTASNDAGSIQERITQAIKGAEFLNDQEKENVRQYQFVFEQFYKSASGALQKINQIIEKVAQGIGR